MEESRESWRRALCGLLACSTALSVVAATSNARACSYVAVWTELITERTRPDGIVLWRVSCQGPGVEFCATGEPRVRVGLEGSSDEVSGKLEFLRGGDANLYVAFHPDAALQDGREYWTILEDDGSGAHGVLGEEDARVRVDAQYSPEVPEPDEAEVSLGSDREGVGDRYCCGGGVACFQQCLTEQQIVRATLRAELPAGPDFLYRLHYLDAPRQEDAEPTSTAWVRGEGEGFFDRVAVAPFVHPREHFCATVEVLALATGKTQSLEYCEQAAPEVEVGATVAAELGPDGFQGDCDAPPRREGCAGDDDECFSEPLRDLWCEDQASCESGDDGCAAYPEGVSRYCATGAGPAGEGSEPSNDGGCGVAVGARSNWLPEAWLLTLLGLAWRARSRLEPQGGTPPRPGRGRAHMRGGADFG